MDVVERLELLVKRRKRHRRRSRRWDRLIKLAISGKQNDSELLREWLEKVIDLKGVGYGLNIGCGDFPIANTEGVDINPAVFGVDWVTSGDDLHFHETESVDYVVTNYMEVFVDPIKLFKEWYRVLKPTGFIAIVCANADKYDPLVNSKKNIAFTFHSLKDYLNRSGFSLEEINARGDHLYAVAYKGDRSN